MHFGRARQHHNKGPRSPGRRHRRSLRRGRREQRPMPTPTLPSLSPLRYRFPLRRRFAARDISIRTHRYRSAASISSRMRPRACCWMDTRSERRPASSNRSSPVSEALSSTPAKAASTSKPWLSPLAPRTTFVSISRRHRWTSPVRWPDRIKAKASCRALRARRHEDSTDRRAFASGQAG